jgi:hypothetical protein
MSNATELLERALEAWDFVDEPQFDDINAIMEEIRAFLAAETEAGPVAWIVETERQDGSYNRWVCLDEKRYKEHHDSPNPIIPLYTKPEPVRKSMTNEVIKERAEELGFGPLCAMAFAIGTRYAEKHHKIGESDE